MREDSGILIILVIPDELRSYYQYLFDFGYIEQYENEYFTDLYSLTPKGIEWFINKEFKATGRLN